MTAIKPILIYKYKNSDIQLTIFSKIIGTFVEEIAMG